MSACYHIYVNGRLDERWLRWFEGHSVEYLDNGKTLIVLTAVDQPALFGVINRIRDLGLELISVVQCPNVQGIAPKRTM